MHVAIPPTSFDSRRYRMLWPIALLAVSLTACSTDGFKAGEGSLTTIERFAETLAGDGALDGDLLTSEGADYFQKTFDSLRGDRVRSMLLSPAAKKTKLKGLAGRDEALPNHRVERDVKLQVSSEKDGVDFEAMYVVRLTMTGEPGGSWKIDKAATVSTDLTLANTSLIFKIYYGWVFFLVWRLLTTAKQTFSRRALSPTEVATFSRGFRAPGFMIITFVFGVSWFLVFFPRTFMSHFGFYWGLAMCTLTMQLCLIGYNARHFYGRMPLASVIGWALSFVPIAVFALYQSKFTPEQTSAMELAFNGPALVEVSQTVKLHLDPSPDSPEVGTATPGTKLGYLGTHAGRDGGFHRVVFEDAVIAFLPAAAAKIVSNQRVFKTEAELTTELVSLFRPVQKLKGASEASASIGDVYFQQGLRSARRSAVRDHLEALSRYNEALRYVDSEDIELAKAVSFLEVARLMRHDNILNIFGTLQPAAVSYNKTQALASYTIDSLKARVTGTKTASDRSALIGLAYRFAADDAKEAASKIDNTQGDGPYFLLAKAFMESNPEKALGLWEAVVRQDPASSGNNTQLGMALLRVGDYERARLAFVRGAALGPDNTEARTGLAAALAAQKKTDESLKTMAEAKLLGGYNSEAKLLELVSRSLLVFLGITLACLAFVVFAPFSERLTDSVAGAWLRALAVGIVFTSVLVGCWYYLARIESADSTTLQTVVAASLESG